MNTAINDRIDVRISKDQKDLIQYASHLQGFKSVSEFIISCVSREAREIVAENSQVLKSMEDKKIFVNALQNPPAPNATIKKAHLNYKKFIESNGSTHRTSNKRTR